MRKFYTLIALIPLIVLSLLPPMELNVPMVGYRAFVLLIFLAGFLGFYSLFLEIPLAIKFLSAYLFINCFLSYCVYVAFAAYLAFALCLLFYFVCLKIADWQPVARSLAVTLVLVSLMSLVQAGGKDFLCNFGTSYQICFGIIGNVMCLRSFLLCLLALLIAVERPKFITNKKCLLVIAILGIAAFAIYATKPNFFKYLVYARGQVAWDTVKLWMKTPYVFLFGYGMGSFKVLFQLLAHGTYVQEGMWTQAHNCWVQIPFEIGCVGLGIVVAYTIRLLRKLWAIRDIPCIAGVLLVASDMMVHFPTRQPPTLLMIIMLLAYCQKRIQGGVSWQGQEK